MTVRGECHAAPAGTVFLVVAPTAHRFLSRSDERPIPRGSATDGCGALRPPDRGMLEIERVHVRARLRGDAPHPRSDQPPAGGARGLRRWSDRPIECIGADTGSAVGV
jgi:hypothetical protein